MKSVTYPGGNSTPLAEESKKEEKARKIEYEKF